MVWWGRWMSTVWIYKFTPNLRYTAQKRNFNVIFTHVWEKNLSMPQFTKRLPSGRIIWHRSWFLCFPIKSIYDFSIFDVLIPALPLILGGPNLFILPWSLYPQHPFSGRCSFFKCVMFPVFFCDIWKGFAGQLVAFAGHIPCFSHVFAGDIRPPCLLAERQPGRPSLRMANPTGSQIERIGEWNPL